MPRGTMHTLLLMTSDYGVLPSSILFGIDSTRGTSHSSSTSIAPAIPLNNVGKSGLYVVLLTP